MSDKMRNEKWKNSGNSTTAREKKDNSLTRHVSFFDFFKKKKLWKGLE
jgi:hypothetical protein